MDPFKVMIVGASVAGLTLANLLEKAGIDFVVLEACAEVAAVDGSAMLWHANGLGTLRQLGCVEDMRRVSVPLRCLTTRTDNGYSFCSRLDEACAGSRPNDDAVMTDRRQAVRVLYSNLEAKAKVLTGQRVVAVEEVGDQVRLRTEGGRSFQANIVVGANGFDSIVWQEMLWMAWAKASCNMAADESHADFDYGCLYGRSRPTGDLKASEAYVVHSHHATLTVLVGPDDTPYWHWAFKLPKNPFSHEHPTPPCQHERIMVYRKASILITPSVSFGHLYDNALSSHTSTPFCVPVKSLHRGGLMVMGYSGFKLDPISRQGANHEIELAAALADSLRSALAEAHGRLSMQQMDAVFTQAVARRQAGVVACDEQGTKYLGRRSRPRSRLLCTGSHSMPLTGRHAVEDALHWWLAGGYESSALPSPPDEMWSSEADPFDDDEDERAQDPQPSWPHWLAAVAAYLVIWLLAWGSGGEHGRGAATGDEGQLVSYAPTPSAQGPPGPGLQGTLQELVVLAVWAMESFRVRSRWSLAAIVPYLGLATSMLPTRTVLLGAGAIFLLDSLLAADPRRWQPAAIFVPRNSALSVILAAVTTLTEAALMTVNDQLCEGLLGGCTMWTLYPIHLCHWVWTFPWFILGDQASENWPNAGPESRIHVRRAYALLGLAAAAVHLASVPSGLVTVFAVLQGLGLGAEDAPLAAKLAPLGLSRPAGVLSGLLLAWGFSSMLAARRAGITRVRTARLLLAMFVGSVVLGPEATATGCAYLVEGSFHM